MELDQIVEGLPNLHIDQIFEVLVLNENRICMGN